MPERPYVLLSAAVSADGHIDDVSPRRLVLSGADDLDRVDEVRAGVDAILVGAGTVRADNPRLLVRSAARRAARGARGLPVTPLRVTITATGDLDPAAEFFVAAPDDLPAGERAGQIVYATGTAAARVRALGTAAVVVTTGGAGTGGAGTGGAGTGEAGLAAVLADLGDRGVSRLLVEGGTAVLSGFLAAGLADELHLVIAPFFVGGGPRLTRPGSYPHGPVSPMRLAEVSRLGDAVLLRYLL